MSCGPVLKCTDLRVRYPGQDLYAVGSESVGVSFSVNRGELFALLGPSGCGKTTTLRIIGGFIEPTSGKVEIEGVDVTRRQPYERPTNTVFQSYALFPHLRVEGNVAYGLEDGGRLSRRSSAQAGDGRRSISSVSRGWKGAGSPSSRVVSSSVSRWRGRW